MAFTVVNQQEQQQEQQQQQQQQSWEVHYSRFFSYLPPTSIPSPSPSPPLSSLNRIRFYKRSWLSSATPTVKLSLAADPSRNGLILLVSFHDQILELHYVSMLRFSWPQLSSTSDVPHQSSLVVFANYKDGASLTQKFALRFSTNYEVEEFVTILENGFSKKQCLEDFMTTTRSSQSEARDMLSEMVLSGASQILDTTLIPYQAKASDSSQDYTPNIRNGYVPEISESYMPVFPPRFTTYVTNCSEMVAHGQGEVAASTATPSHEIDLKSLVIQYMEDASFLDLLSKAEELIAEMGDGMTIQQFL